MKVWVKGSGSCLWNIDGVFFDDPGMADGRETMEFEVMRAHDWSVLGIAESRIRAILVMPNVPYTIKVMLEQALEDLKGMNEKSEGKD